MPENRANQRKPESDEALAARAALGDRAAFVALYDRYFAEVYDFLLRMLPSPAEAERAVLSTFVRLGRRLSGGGRRGRPRLEVLAAAYQTAMEPVEPSTLRRADEAQEEQQASAFTELAPDSLSSSEERAQAQEEAPIIWEAASSLDRREYGLLDLHLRRRLKTAEVARVVGMDRFTAWRTIGRLKGIAEDAFTSLLRLRLVGAECPELQRLAAVTQRAIMPLEARRQVNAHVAACPACSEASMRLIPALDVLAALLSVPPPPGLKDTTLRNLMAYVEAHAAPSAPAASRGAAALGRGRPMGPPPRQPGRSVAGGGGSAGGRSFAVLMGAAAAVVVPLVALAIWLVALSGDGGGESASAGATMTPVGPVATEVCGPPLAEGEDGEGTARVTCTPTATPTPSPTATSAPATLTPTPTGTASATPSPSVTATPPPTATQPLTMETPIGEGTPLGVVETATPGPSQALSPTPGTAPTSGPLASPPPLPP